MTLPSKSQLPPDFPVFHKTSQRPLIFQKEFSSLHSLHFPGSTPYGCLSLGKIHSLPNISPRSQALHLQSGLTLLHTASFLRHISSLTPQKPQRLPAPWWSCSPAPRRIQGPRLALASSPCVPSKWNTATIKASCQSHLLLPRPSLPAESRLSSRNTWHLPQLFHSTCCWGFLCICLRCPPDSAPGAPGTAPTGAHQSPRQNPGSLPDGGSRPTTG